MKYAAIAAAIKKARLARKWSQERAAQEIGTSRIHWIRWEQGLHRPGPEFSRRLVERLGVPKELLEDDEDDVEAALAMELLTVMKRVNGVNAA